MAHGDLGEVGAVGNGGLNLREFCIERRSEREYTSEAMRNEVFRALLVKTG